MNDKWIQAAIITLLVIACIAVWLAIATWQMVDYTTADEIYAAATHRALMGD